jgi:hypothetical protein
MQTTSDRIKYLYVLVTNHQDYYYEQALLSITSLRDKMPDAFISLLVDDKTALSLHGAREQIKALIDEFKIVSLPDELPNTERSRWLKTTMRKEISGDFLYIDCDTIIASDLSVISNLDANLGAVADAHCDMDNFCKRYPGIANWYSIHSITGFSSLLQSGIYFNGGVILCKDKPTVHDFFAEWHKLWLISVSKGFSYDQAALKETNSSFGNMIQELDGIWNCLTCYDGSIVHLSDSKIIHYQFSMLSNRINQKAYLLPDPSIFEDIKKAGKITPSVRQILQNPRAAFSSRSRVIGMNDSMSKFMSSAVFDFYLKRVYTRPFAFFESILLRIFRIKDLLRRIKVSILRLSNKNFFLQYF